MEAAKKFVGLFFLVSLTLVAADYSSILSSIYQKANQNKRPLILVLDKNNEGSKTPKRLVVANRENNNRYDNQRYDNQRYRDTNLVPYNNEYVIDNRNTDYRSSSNSRNRDLRNNRNEVRNDRIKNRGSNDVRQSSYDLDRNAYRSVSNRDSSRNHVARFLNRQAQRSQKRHSSVRASNRYQRTRSNSHEMHHDHFNYYSHPESNHYHVHEPKYDNDVHYHNGEHIYHNPNELYKVYEPSHVHHMVDSQENNYYGPQLVSVSQSHGHSVHDHYPLRDIKSSKKQSIDQNRYDARPQSNIRHGYDSYSFIKSKDSTRLRSKKYLRSSVVKSLLRVANDIQCDALDECEDDCKQEEKNECEDECQENFECEEEKKLDECEKDECADTTEDDNPSTRGIVEDFTEDTCNNCKFDK